MILDIFRQLTRFAHRSSSRAGRTGRSRASALFGVALVLGAVTKSVGVEDQVVLWSLIKDSDAIINGKVVEQRVVDAGSWYRIRVVDVLWGEVTDNFVNVFSYGPNVPESVVLSPEDRGIFGLRWISEDGGRFQRDLLATLYHDGGHASALVAADAVIFEREPDEADLVAQSIRAMTACVRSSGQPSEENLVEVAALLDSEQTFVREAVLRTFAELDAELPDEVVSSLQEGLTNEVDGQQNSKVLQGFFDVIRNKKVPLDPDDVCHIVVTHNEANVASEGIEALRNMESNDVLSTLLTHFPGGTSVERGRIVRALSRLEWHGAVDLCRHALESDEWELYVDSVEALGDLSSEEATVVLLEVVEQAPRRDQVRGLALEALTLQKTQHSFRALQNLLDRDHELNDREKRNVKRCMSNPAKRLRCRRNK